MPPEISIPRQPATTTASPFNLPVNVTINQAAGQADPTKTQPINFTVVFSQSVTGFSSSGVSLAGSTANVSAANIRRHAAAGLPITWR